MYDHDASPEFTRSTSFIGHMNLVNGQFEWIIALALNYSKSHIHGTSSLIRQGNDFTANSAFKDYIAIQFKDSFNNLGVGYHVALINHNQIRDKTQDTA